MFTLSLILSVDERPHTKGSMSWSDLCRVLLTFHTQMARIHQNNRTVCSFSMFFWGCFFSWNSSLMISNQCCAHTQRQIIRTQCFWQSKQMTGTVSIHNLKTKFEPFSAHVLAADLRQWVITNCSLKLVFFISIQTTASKHHGLQEISVPLYFCSLWWSLNKHQRVRRTVRCCLSCILTLYSRIMPLWVLWGGGSQDTLILELLVSWTTDTACGGALKTGDRDKKENYISPL